MLDVVANKLNGLDVDKFDCERYMFGRKLLASSQTQVPRHVLPSHACTPTHPPSNSSPTHHAHHGPLIDPQT